MIDGDPAWVEGELLDEQERIEYELGARYFNHRDQLTDE